MAESLLTGFVFTFFITLMGRDFVSGICKLKPKKTKRPKNLFFKRLETKNLF